MELEGENGAKIFIEKGNKKELGRGLGLFSDDLTVSRRQISLQLQGFDESKGNGNYLGQEISMSFEVLGKNPICVTSQSDGFGVSTPRAFRRFEKGFLRIGDRVSLSMKNPQFFTVNKMSSGEKEEEDEATPGEAEEKRVLEAVARREKRTMERKKMEEGEKAASADLMKGVFVEEGDDEEQGKPEDLGLDSIDISQIDPVKEFGFLVMGHEFDHYPRQKIRSVKNWDWFLEEPNVNSEDDDDGEYRSKVRRSVKKNKKEGEGNEDEDWTGECEDEKVVIAKLRNGKRPKTRLKDREKPDKDELTNNMSKRQKSHQIDDDEDEETLGGFIVKDDELEEEAEEEEEEEEEDYDEDEDEEMEDTL